MDSFSHFLLLVMIMWPIMALFPILHSTFSRVLGVENQPRRAPGSQCDGASDDTGSSASSDSEHHDASDYEPSPMDVHVVKLMLQRGLQVPAEIVLTIIDHAQYWPHGTSEFTQGLTAVGGTSSENSFVLRANPLGLIKKTHNDPDLYMHLPVSPLPLADGAEYPLEQYQSWIGGPTDTVQHPCRKIVFTITSHDQGWSHNASLDRGSYRGSYTWFEAGVERFDRTAQRPKESPEMEASLTRTEYLDEQKKTTTTATTIDKGEASSLASAGDAGGKELTPGLPYPYLPVYALRPIYPTLEADRPALHHDLLASPKYTINYNKTATRQPQTHTIVWSYKDSDAVSPGPEALTIAGRGAETGNGLFVRSLKLGDVVTVWAKARFPAWSNIVDAVKVEVYWAL